MYLPTPGLAVYEDQKLTRWLACVQYASTLWQDFVRDCELFSQAPSCVQAGVTNCAKPVATSPWWVQILGQLWRPATYDYGSGIVPNQGEGWQSYAAEGEVRSSHLPAMCTQS